MRASPTARPESLASLSREDFVEQHRKWWHPGNSALVISGGIDSARADALAASLFGGWRGEGPAPVPPAERAGPAQKVRTIVIDLPGAGQAAVLAAVRGISRSDPLYYQVERGQCRARRRIERPAVPGSADEARLVLRRL